VVTTGFSFNAKPAEQLRRAYAQVDERVRFNVRDRVSLKRFKEFTMRDGHLTADVAFLLDPKSFREEPEIKTWADECRGRGVPVVGLNVNPMLAYRASPEVLRHRLAQVALALQEVRRRQPFALLLISHDVRATDADEGCLRKVCEALLSEFGDDVRMAPLGLAADELKSLVRLTDAVVTGRMHLAIAALGVGVPIAGLSYQGKFQGLLDWFDLPHSLIVSPEQMETPETFSEALSKLLSDHQSLKRKVVTRAPEVLSAAKSNLSLQSS
jgi:polysaccharide pyruvyl transferase WcaK-like protein